MENVGIEGGASDYVASVLGDVRSPLLVLLAAVGSLLLIACVNVANLFLTRASARQREFSVRTALGAGRGRLARQFLTEAALLGALGGSVAAGLSASLVRLMRIFGPGEIPRLQSITLDLPVLVFAAALTVVCVLLFGLAPIFGISRIEIGDALKEGGRSSTAGRGAGVLRNVLAVAQVTLALVLLIGAGLLLRSLYYSGMSIPGLRPRIF